MKVTLEKFKFFCFANLHVSHKLQTVQNKTLGTVDHFMWLNGHLNVTLSV